MGRPSVLEARAEKRAGVVVEARIGGASVLVSEGFIKVDRRRPGNDSRRFLRAASGG